MAEALIEISAADESVAGMTDAAGNFSGPVPQGVPLQLKIYTDCGTVHSVDIGPFDADAVLPPVVVPGTGSSDEILITGRLVDCNQQPVANGYIRISDDVTNPVVFSDNAGNFTLNIGGPCFNPAIIAFNGFDLTTLTSSNQQVVNFQPGTVEVGDVVVCTPSDEYVVYTVNGENYQTPNVEHYRYDGDIIYAELPGQFIRLKFAHTGQTGTFPLSDFHVTPISIQDTIINAQTINVTITEYGAAGGHITGSFGGQAHTLGGGSSAVSGVFRVRREE